MHHPRIASRYLAGAAAGLIVSAFAGGGAWLLLYPAASCAAVAYVYASNRPELLPKYLRTAPLWSTVVFGPYLLGAWCSWRCYATRLTRWSPLSNGLLIGRRLHSTEMHQLQNAGIAAVLDLAPELPGNCAPNTLAYRHVPMLDLVAPTQEQLDAALEFITAQPRDCTLLIHCALGLSRSALVAAAWLVQQGQPLHAALERVRTERNGVALNEAMLNLLSEFERKHGSTTPC
jgi:protein-tyrosine phosphatase